MIKRIADLHYTIQIALGWSDSHLNRFHIHGKDYGVAHEGGIWFDDNPEKVHLAGFGFRLHERFLYEYDFYDLWEHDVRLEKVLPWKGRLCPVCTGGRRLAPLEDCGGARAYNDIERVFPSREKRDLKRPWVVISYLRATYSIRTDATWQDSNAYWTK